MSQQPKIETVQDEKEEVDVPGAPKLSKNQKKKLKQQAKKEAEKAKAAENAEQKKEEGGQAVEEKKQQEKKDKKKDGKKPNATALKALKNIQRKRLQQQDFQRKKKEFEQEQKRLEAIEQQKQRLAKIEKDKRKLAKKQAKEKMKRQGLYVAKKDKKRLQRDRQTKQHLDKMKNDDDDSDDDSEDEDNNEQITTPTEVKTEEVKPAQVPVAQKVQQKPKKKYVKPKVQTLEQIYAEILKKKAQQAQKANNLQNVQDWEQLANNKQAKPAEVVEQKKVEEPVVTVPKAEKEKKQEKKDKKKKKQKEKEAEQQVQKKKQEPEPEFMIDKKKYFEIDENEKYRSPICCILGHVDTGKTSILDKIRRTSVQQNEAGGITQQIGATFFPKDKLIKEVAKCNKHYPIEANVPGLLIIDTPGHESFSNLRSRGSSLCDIAILVIDLMHGLQNQTLESIKMLKSRGTHFVVALNKIDRSYQWKTKPDDSSYVSLMSQDQTTIQDYNNRLNQVKLQLNTQGFNIAMYWENQDINEYVSLIPTSAKTGQGLPDLMSVLVKECMSIPSIQKRLRLNNKKFNCTVMEVKMIQGHGTTIDCILVDGILHKNDQIVLLGFNGPIVTKIKALLTPHPMKQMRVKDQYIYHDYIRAANGVKIDAPGIDSAVAGTPLFVANTQQQVQRAIDLCNSQYLTVKNKIKLSDMGVGVAASTLGSLQALLDYLSVSKVPVSYVTVGPVSKEDVMKAMKSVLSQNSQRRKKQYCCVLVFDVKVLEDARRYAEENHIKIFWADIIYHLTDHFNKFVKQIKEQRKQKEGKDAIFPCVLKIVEIFRKNEPIVLGVDVEQGVLKVGTPLSVYNKEGTKLKIGIVESIESNHKKIKEARKAAGSVAIAITGQKIVAGKDFLQTDRLCSLISRKSIDCLKQHFRDDVNNDEWKLVIELKKYLGVQ